MKYKFFEHTADVKFQAFGKTLDEAFSNAALAMVKVITESTIQKKKKETIKVSSEDEQALLYDFLEQFLVFLDSDGFLLSEVESISILEKNGVFSLDAVVWGDSVKPEYEINTHIKAVTYNQMFLKKNESGFVVQVVLDL